MRAAAAAAVLLAAAAVTGCGAPPGPAQPPATRAAAPAPQHRYLGVSSPGGMPGVARFAAATGTHPDLVSWYAGWYEPFDAGAVRAAGAWGAMPLIFLDSGRVPLTVIASRPSAWLAGYARAVAAWGKPVAISFDSEFNGPWWPWSFQHETPAVFTAAWRRVVATFRQAGASNVTWVWTVAASSPVTTALGPWWPGAAWVDWAGVNAYYTTAGATFARVFARTLRDIARVTPAPVLVTETGASPAAGRARSIASLFAGVESTPGVLGFIWFDYDKAPAHDWRIDDDPAALAAFRAAAREYG